MLELKPLSEKTAKKALSHLCGIPYREDTLCYVAYDGGTPVGISEFTVKGNVGHILKILKTPSCKNPKVPVFLGQATTAFMETEKVKTVYYDGGKEDLAEALFFEKKDGKWQILLNGGESMENGSGFL